MNTCAAAFDQHGRLRNGLTTVILDDTFNGDLRRLLLRYSLKSAAEGKQAYQCPQ